MEVRLRELDLRETELDLQPGKLNCDSRERELESILVLRRLEVNARREGISDLDRGKMYVGRNITLVPPFSERDVEKYFL